MWGLVTKTVGLVTVKWNKEQKPAGARTAPARAWEGGCVALDYRVHSHSVGLLPAQPEVPLLSPGVARWQTEYPGVPTAIHMPPPPLHVRHLSHSQALRVETM